MALETAKLFVQEGAYVFITGRQQDKLDEAVHLIGSNVTGVQGDASITGDLDRLYETVKKEKGHIDIVFASAGLAGFASLGSVSEEQFDAIFDLNARGTFFTIQKAFPLLRDNASIIMNGSVVNVMGIPGMAVYKGSKAVLHSFARVWLEELKTRGRLCLVPQIILQETLELREALESKNRSQRSSGRPDRKLARASSVVLHRAGPSCNLEASQSQI
jgi:NAD(P)-dependent dehydrogenase (short-subunit alcohol dehydrogenase family)